MVPGDTYLEGRYWIQQVLLRVVRIVTSLMFIETTLSPSSAQAWYGAWQEPLAAFPLFNPVLSKPIHTLAKKISQNCEHNWSSFLKLLVTLWGRASGWALCSGPLPTPVL